MKIRSICVDISLFSEYLQNERKFLTVTLCGNSLRVDIARVKNYSRDRKTGWPTCASFHCNLGRKKRVGNKRVLSAVTSLLTYVLARSRNVFPLVFSFCVVVVLSRSTFLFLIFSNDLI